jgi:hypothetical protein
VLTLCPLQVVYHVVTMIPNQVQIYRGYQNKKRHIGNDNVNIVYSDSPMEFKQDTIQVHSLTLSLSLFSPM